MKAGADAKALKLYCFLAGSSWLAPSIQDHLPRIGPTHSGLGLPESAPPTSVLNQEKALQLCLQANLMMDIFLIEVFPFQMT